MLIESVLAGIVSNAITGLATSGLRAQGSPHEGATPVRLDGDDSADTLAVTSYPIALALMNEGVSEPAAMVARDFLKSDEGRVCTRYATLVAIGTAHEDPPDALVEVAAALLILYAPRPVQADQIAAIICAESLAASRHAFEALEKADKPGARALREFAEHELREGALLGNLPGATAQIRLLTEIDATHVRAEVSKLAHSVASSTADIEVPSLTEARRIPIDAIYVPRLFSSRGGANTRWRSNKSPESLDDLLEKHHRLVVLGEPGGGKTTLLQSHVHSLALRLVGGTGVKIPIVVSVRKYNEYRSRNARPYGLTDYVADQLAAARSCALDHLEFEYLLALGKVLLLFDGLDEVLAIPERTEIRDEIEALGNRYPATAMVVTSRTVGYDEVPFSSAQFSTAVLPTFGDTEIKDFTLNFFSASAAFEPADSSDAMEDFLEKSKELHDLRSNPLMLGLLCLLYEAGKTLPTSRSALYDDCSRLLFAQWDKRRGIEVPLADSAPAKDAITRVAYEVFRSGTEEFSETWLRTTLVSHHLEEHSRSLAAAQGFADEVINVWRGRQWLIQYLGVESGVDRYRFVHRTFMEYFAAMRLAFTRASVTQFWGEIEDLVTSRSATVFVSLAAEKYAERGKSELIEFLRLLTKRVAGIPSEETWAVALFAAEVIGSTSGARHEAEAAIREIVACVAQTIPISKDPPDRLTELSTIPLTKLRQAFGTPDWVNEPPEPDLDELPTLLMPLERAILPLATFATFSRDRWDVCLPSVAEQLSAGATDRALSLQDRARYVKLALMASEVGDALHGVRLASSESTRFRESMESIVSDLMNRLQLEDYCRLDHWLDMLLASGGYVRPSSLCSGHSVTWLLQGGFNVDTNTRPRVGAPIHALLKEVLDGFDASTRAGEESLVDASNLLAEGASLRVTLDKVDEYSRPSNGLTQPTAQAIRNIEHCNPQARAGIAYLLCILARLEPRHVEAWEAQSDSLFGKVARFAMFSSYDMGSVQTADALEVAFATLAAQPPTAMTALKGAKHNVADTLRIALL